MNYSSNTTKNLVEKIRNNDVFAFRFIFKTYYKQLVSFSYKYVFDLQTAENIVEDIFVKIWTSRKTFNITTDVKSYLFASVKNGSLNHLKHLKVKQTKLKIIKENHPKVKTPYDTLVSKEITTEVQKAINELPEKGEIIFRMHRFENLKYSEIAKKLNISISTVETHMVRSLKFLRKRLSHLLPLSTSN